MATNNFLPFGTDAGAHVESQSAYAADSDRDTGQDAGTTASNTLANKAWRQATSIAATIGQFVVDVATLDMLDNGNIATLVTNFTEAIQVLIDATISTLGTAATKDVTDPGQPDVVSVIAPVTVGNIAVFADGAGTIEDGGPLSGSLFESPEFSGAPGTTTGAEVFYAHGFSTTPKDCALFARCKTAEGGYSVGDEINTNAGTLSVLSTWLNATYVGVSMVPISFWEFFNKTNPCTGGAFNTFHPDILKWKLILRAWS